MLRLRTAEHIIEWKLCAEDDPARVEILTEFMKGKLRQALNYFLPSTNLSKINKLTDKHITSSLDAIYKNNIAFEKMLPIIGQNILHLFELNYFEYTIALLLEQDLTPNKKAEILQLIKDEGAEEAFNNANSNTKCIILCSLG